MSARAVLSGAGTVTSRAVLGQRSEERVRAEAGVDLGARCVVRHRHGDQQVDRKQLRAEVGLELDVDLQARAPELVHDGQHAERPADALLPRARRASAPRRAS